VRRLCRAVIERATLRLISAISRLSEARVTATPGLFWRLSSSSRADYTQVRRQHRPLRVCSS